MQKLFRNRDMVVLYQDSMVLGVGGGRDFKKRAVPAEKFLKSAKRRRLLAK